MNSSTTKRGKEKKLKDTFYPKENIHFPTQRERERSLDFNCSVVELGREKKSVNSSVVVLVQLLQVLYQWQALASKKRIELKLANLYYYE